MPAFEQPGSPVRPAPRRQYWLLLKCALACALIWYIVARNKLSIADSVYFIVPGHRGFTAAAVLCFLASQICAAYRLKLLLGSMNLMLPFTRIFFFTMAGMFYNQFIPGSFGGDIVKGILLFRDEIVRKGTSAGILVIDRIIGVLTIAVIGMLSFLYLTCHQQGFTVNAPGRWIAPLGLIMLLICLSMFLAIVLTDNVKLLRTWLPTAWSDSIPYYALAGMKGIMTQKKLMADAFLLSAGIQLFSIAGLMILSSLIPHNHAGLLITAAVTSIILLLGTIPLTPGNIGWTEALGSAGWATLGSTAGGLIFLCWRLIALLCSLPFGVMCFFMVKKPT